MSQAYQNAVYAHAGELGPDAVHVLAYLAHLADEDGVAHVNSVSAIAQGAVVPVDVTVEVLAAQYKNGNLFRFTQTDNGPQTYYVFALGRDARGPGSEKLDPVSAIEGLLEDRFHFPPADAQNAMANWRAAGEESEG